MFIYMYTRIQSQGKGTLYYVKVQMGRTALVHRVDTVNLQPCASANRCSLHLCVVVGISFAPY